MTEVHYYQPRRSHGCLWGCLGVAVIVALPIIIAWGYGSWYLYHGFRDSPVVRAAVALAQQDRLAQSVLGEPIRVVGVDGNAFTFSTGVGAHTSYVLRLEGSKADGTLAVTAHAQGGKARVDSMTLTGPDGRHYDLLHHGSLPGDSDSQAI